LRGLRKFSGDLECSNTGIDSRQACPELCRRSAKHAKFGIEKLIILQTILFIFSDLCGLGSAKQFGADPSFGGVFAGDIPNPILFTL
jgi:hypothetical protein